MADPSGRNWDFTLADAKWQDGTPVTADDLVFTIQKMNDPRFQRGIAPRLLKSTAVALDSRTVRITLAAPEGFMASLASDIELHPKAYIEKNGDQVFESKPIGTGPFIVTEFVPENRIVMKAWPDSFRYVPGGPAEIQWFNLADSGTRLAALRTGEIDIMADVSPDQIAAVKVDGARIADTFGTQFTRWQFATEAPEFQDRRVRQAINLAVDKQAVVDQIFGGFGGVLPGQLMGPTVFGFNPAVQAYPYDPARARALLAEAGFPNGFRTAVKYSASTLGATDVASATAENMTRVGIQTEIRLMEPAVLIAETREVGRRTGLYLLPGGGTFDGLSPLFTLDSTNPRLYANNKDLDRAIQAAQVELDIDKRRKFIQDANAIMRDDAPVVFMFFTPQLWGIGKRVDGFTFADNSRFYLNSVSLK
jgi:peptide/nickel transport system substrate-binding protein